MREAQGKGEEAEALLREALERADRAPPWIYNAHVESLARFLAAHGRPEEAAGLEPRTGSLAPAE